MKNRTCILSLNHRCIHFCFTWTLNVKPWKRNTHITRQDKTTQENKNMLVHAGSPNHQISLAHITQQVESGRRQPEWSWHSHSWILNQDRTLTAVEEAVHWKLFLTSSLTTHDLHKILNICHARKFRRILWLSSLVDCPQFID